MSEMKVDYHLHLEEGPYSPNWIKRTMEAIARFDSSEKFYHSREYINEQAEKLQERLQNGPFTMEWLDLYLEQAKRIGIQEMGLVDHLYRFKEFKPYYEKHIYLEDDELGKMQRKWLEQVCNESHAQFVELVQEAKEKWASRGVKLRLGMETDYFVGGEAELREILANHPYDYVIGSVHFLNGWGFDNPETQHLYQQFDLVELYEDFFSVVEQAIASEIFDYVAHLDNLKVFGFRPDEKKLLSLYEKIAKKLIETDTITEINAGLYYRYPIKEMCPSPAFLKILANHHVPITISSDAHFPDDMGRFAETQLQMLRDVGITEVATFENGKRIMQAIEKER